MGCFIFLAKLGLRNCLNTKPADQQVKSVFRNTTVHKIKHVNRVTDCLSVQKFCHPITVSSVNNIFLLPVKTVKIVNLLKLLEKIIS